MRSTMIAMAAGMMLAASIQPASAEKKYGPGVSDTEIKLGQTMPYSGGASSISIMGKVQTAYFKMINSQGGISGRKINLISLDDGFSPPKTVEHTRRLVEGDEVLAIYSSMGSGPNLAVAKYLNDKKVPQLLAQAGTPKMLDPINLPWTTTFTASLRSESKIFARYLTETRPNAKIGILYQNDESGKALLEGFKVGLGDKATMIVKEAGFEVSTPTIDSQISMLQSSGADTVFFATVSPKFGAQGIRKIGELGWRPLNILHRAVSSVENTLKPAGLDHSTGAITTMFQKEPGDPKWANDPAVLEFLAFMKQWVPGEPAADPLAVLGYVSVQVLVDVLKKCGDELTRENLQYQVTHIKDYQSPMFLDGIKINISPENREAVTQAQWARFDGQKWVFEGNVVTAPGN